MLDNNSRIHSVEQNRIQPDHHLTWLQSTIYIEMGLSFLFISYLPHTECTAAGSGSGNWLACGWA